MANFYDEITKLGVDKSHWGLIYFNLVLSYKNKLTYDKLIEYLEIATHLYEMLTDEELNEKDEYTENFKFKFKRYSQLLETAKLYENFIKDQLFKEGIF